MPTLTEIAHLKEVNQSQADIIVEQNKMLLEKMALLKAQNIVMEIWRMREGVCN